MIELTDEERAVFHALFTDGGLCVDHLPSKTGADSLIDRGYAMIFRDRYHLTQRGHFYWSFYVSDKK